MSPGRSETLSLCDVKISALIDENICFNIGVKFLTLKSLNLDLRRCQDFSKFVCLIITLFCEINSRIVKSKFNAQAWYGPGIKEIIEWCNFTYLIFRFFGMILFSTHFIQFLLLSSNKTEYIRKKSNFRCIDDFYY